jgi:BetI-type transcriptional repressor, C-terminal
VLVAGPAVVASPGGCGCGCSVSAGCRPLVQDLAGPGRPGHDIEQETHRLHALVDGPAVHTAMRPDTTTPEGMLAIVGAHLHALEHALA